MPWLVTDEEAESLANALPREVVARGFEPVIALLVTLYILYIGHTFGEEMAATAGFPTFPADPAEWSILMRDLRSVDQQWMSDLIRTLRQSLHDAPRDDVPENAGTAEERLLAVAITNDRSRRTEPERSTLISCLSDISASSKYDREDIEDWNPGLKAIARVTRLMIKAVAPPQIGTMSNLTKADSGLRTISTLGGALFLGNSIAVLISEKPATPPSRYAELGGRIARLTDDMGGQIVTLPGPEAAERYVKGLAGFAKSGESTFAIEHPFHFRVLLEVLSDENRRYPAEPVLNVEALRLILPRDSFWSHVVWSRDQLPVVVNLLRPPEKQRADAFIQHYAAFGRTPHSSSFTHLDYEVQSPVGDDSASAAWPADFQGYRGHPMQNMPNSVSQVISAVNRQRSFGRLWRGTRDESDLRWLSGQMVAWDGDQERDEALADRIWDSDRWTGQTFPVAALAEIRVGAWLLEALRLRLETAVLPAIRDAELYHDKKRLDRERRSDEELRCVLEVMALFSADYLAGGEDGIPGLTETLRQLRRSDCFTELGPAMGEKLDSLEAALDAHAERLGVEVRKALEALAGP
jgi:hypothetical protein